MDNDTRHSNLPPAQDMYVDFDVRLGHDNQIHQAVEIFAIAETPTVSASTRQKSRTTAGLFAILLGTLGVHKFYLGHIGVLSVSTFRIARLGSKAGELR